jgi:hypothetical protein
MDAFVDFTFYSTTFLGDRLEDDTSFPRRALRASELVNQRTFGRAAPIILADDPAADVELIKFATCAVMDQMAIASQVEGTPAIKSERVGNYSVTYADGSFQSDPERYLVAMATYLGPTGLLYGGFYADE